MLSSTHLKIDRVDRLNTTPALKHAKPFSWISRLQKPSSSCIRQPRIPERLPKLACVAQMIRSCQTQPSWLRVRARFGTSRVPSRRLCLTALATVHSLREYFVSLVRGSNVSKPRHDLGHVRARTFGEHHTPENAGTHRPSPDGFAGKSSPRGIVGR